MHGRTWPAYNAFFICRCANMQKCIKIGFILLIKNEWNVGLKHMVFKVAIKWIRCLVNNFSPISKWVAFKNIKNIGIVSVFSATEESGFFSKLWPPENKLDHRNIISVIFSNFIPKLDDFEVPIKFLSYFLLSVFSETTVVARRTFDSLSPRNYILFSFKRFFDISPSKNLMSKVQDIFFKLPCQSVWMFEKF